MTNIALPSQAPTPAAAHNTGLGAALRHARYILGGKGYERRDRNTKAVPLSWMQDSCDTHGVLPSPTNPACRGWSL